MPTLATMNPSRKWGPSVSTGLEISVDDFHPTRRLMRDEWDTPGGMWLKHGLGRLRCGQI